MEKSALSFTESGRPKYTKAMSCAQKLLDCGKYDGVVDPTQSKEYNDAKVAEICNTQRGVTWDDCCRGEFDLRFRELKEEYQEQAPADEKRKSRKLQLQATTPEEACQMAGGTL